MKTRSLFPAVLFAAFAAAPPGARSARAADIVVLDEIGVKNLKIETVEVVEKDFEETIFSLGRIRVAPGHRAVVSSRVQGRVLSVGAHIDTRIDAGAEAVVLESRQPGDPPPTIRLTAPIGGLVSVVNVVVGQPVSPDDSLLEIIDLSEVHATAAVPEHLVGKLKLGQKAHIRAPGLPERDYAAEIAHLGAEAEIGSGTIEAAFHVENPDYALRPGMRAEFSIVIGKREGVMSIPRSALQGDALDRFVYVEDFDLKKAFLKAPVGVGAQNDRFVEIVSGLFPGDKVVTRGAYSLAFAGSGSVSLKEALDAAHGHEHAADGGELTDAQRAAKAGSEGDEHGHSEGKSAITKFSLAGNALLLALLVVSTLGRGKRAHEEPAAPASKPQLKAEVR